MKLNKKVIIFAPIIVAVLLFIILFWYFNREDANNLTVGEKRWIEDNTGTVVDFEVISNYPVYGDNSGVFYQYIEDFEKATGLQFNIIPYLKNSEATGTSYRFRILDNDEVPGPKDVLLAEDVYVAVGTQYEKINSITDFKKKKLGIFAEDSGELTYYFKTGTDLTYKNYTSVDKMFTDLDNGTVDMVLIPNIMYLDKTVGDNKYSINYTLTEMKKQIVLTLADEDTKLNDIIEKNFKGWVKNNYINIYNSKLLDYYVEQNKINAKTEAELLSKTYVYGYVENSPYEVKKRSWLYGIAAEYINRIQRLTNIDFTYQEYDSIDELENAIDNGEVDIYFNYYDYEGKNYTKTTSTFVERYVVLGKVEDAHVINSFEALKNKKVSLIDNTALFNYFKDNSKANITTYDTYKEMIKKSKSNLLIVDYETYSHYRNSTFEDYEVLFQDVMTKDYLFMVKNDNITFYNLFNYIINTNSYYNYRNAGLNSFTDSIIDNLSFQVLYLLMLLVVFIPLIIITIIVLVLKQKKKKSIVRKEERKKYTDMLTSLKNRNFLNLNIDKWNETNIYPQAIVVTDLNNVKYVNDNYGHEAGDRLIVKAASILVNTQLENSEIVRTDGNEFLIYLVGYSEKQVETYTKKLSKELKELPYGFGAALGYSMIIDDIKTIDDAINEAALEMRTDKEANR